MLKKNANRRVEKKQTLLRDVRGLTTVEYIIIMCLIAVAGFGLWRTFGERVGAKVTSSTTRVDSLPE